MKTELMRVFLRNLFDKMFGRFRENDRFFEIFFVKLCQKVYTFISMLHEVFVPLSYLMVW